jgi:hypothetical protein
MAFRRSPVDSVSSLFDSSPPRAMPRICFALGVAHNLHLSCHAVSIKQTDFAVEQCRVPMLYSHPTTGRLARDQRSDTWLSPGAQTHHAKAAQSRSIRNAARFQVGGWGTYGG